MDTYLLFVWVPPTKPALVVAVSSTSTGARADRELLADAGRETGVDHIRIGNDRATEAQNSAACEHTQGFSTALGPALP